MFTPMYSYQMRAHARMHSRTYAAHARAPTDVDMQPFKLCYTCPKYKIEYVSRRVYLLYNTANNVRHSSWLFYRRIYRRFRHDVLVPTFRKSRIIGVLRWITH